MVNNTTLAEIGRAYDLGSKLQLTPSAEKMGLRDDTKVLADIFEAYMGECWRISVKDGLTMGHYEDSGKPRPFQAFRDYIHVFASPAVFPDLWNEIDLLMKGGVMHTRVRNRKRRRTSDNSDATLRTSEQPV